MNRPAKIALPVLALALACAHANAAGVMLRRPLVTTVAPRPMNLDVTTAKIRPHLTPSGAEWARAEAQRLSSGQISPDAVSGDAQSACSAQSACFDISNMPVEDAVMLMMMLIDNDAEQDMRDQLTAMERERQQKQAMRAAQQQMQEQRQSMRQQSQKEQALQDSKDSISDLSQPDQMQMQSLMDRRKKALDALSIIMMKMEATDDSILKNLK
jgi:hypothetical protein